MAGPLCGGADVGAADVGVGCGVNPAVAVVVYEEGEGERDGTRKRIFIWIVSTNNKRD